MFEREGNKHDESLKVKLKEERLYKQIGHLQVQVAFLKESCDKLGIAIAEDELN